MQNIPTKSTGDSLTAAEFNQIPDELENVILSTGQTLSGADLFQLAKAMAHYAAEGDYYIESGAADAYVLSTVGIKQAPSAYIDGMRVRFIIGNDNTGASTINVATLGVKDIRKTDGSVLLIGELQADVEIELRYDSSAGYFVITDRNMLGVGQSWQDVNASRSAGVTYTNTTKRTIFVSVRLTATGITEGGLSVDTGGGNKSIDFYNNQDPTAVTHSIRLTGAVPPGATYIVGVTTGALSAWNELR